MTYSEIQITFNLEFALENKLTLFSLVNDTSIENSFYWKNIRSAPFQVTTGSPSLVVGERTAMNFVEAFNFDLNNAGQYEVTRLGNVITIKSNDPNELFINIYTCTRNYIGGGNYEEFEIIIPFQTVDYYGGVLNIDTVAFSTFSANPDNNVNVSVETNITAANFTAPITALGNTENPFVFSWMRNQTITVNCDDNLGHNATQVIQTPSFFDISNRNITINPSPYGANITIELNSAPDLLIQYSLDNINWQLSNSFSGIASGNYTIYVRDQYGSNKNFTQLVGANDINSSYFYISKSNSLRFANRITFGTSGNYKNDENTLSCEAYARDKRLAHKEYQLFNSSDLVTTQFKSNYLNNSVLVNKPNGSTDSISVIKKTNNIGLKESLDAVIFAYSTTKTGIYFTSGNNYDFTTGLVNGAHTLFGILPIWAVVGNYIKLGSNFYLIEDIVYDDNKNADVIVFSNPYSGTNDVAQIVGCIYNLFNYEVYEFVIDMVAYISQIISVQIECTDANFQTIKLLSESISVQISHEKTIDIRYWNENNTDIYYATGLRNRIRIPINNFIADDPNESEIHKTDTNAILLSSEMYEGSEIIFEPQTKEMHRKTKQALLHKFVYIDDVRYVLNGNFEVEQLGDSNLYELRVKLLKDGNVFNNNNSSGFEFNNTNDQMPGLISTQSGFVKF